VLLIAAQRRGELQRSPVPPGPLGHIPPSGVAPLDTRDLADATEIDSRMNEFEMTMTSHPSDYWRIGTLGRLGRAAVAGVVGVAAKLTTQRRSNFDHPLRNPLRRVVCTRA
jgi:hypothetical protein